MDSRGTNEGAPEGVSGSYRGISRYTQRYVEGFFRFGIILLILTVFSEKAQSANEATASEAPSAAQRFIPIPHPATMLLRSPSVHRELHLESHQLPYLENVLDEIELRLWQLRDESPEKRNKNARPLLETLPQKLASILTAPQQNRYQQLVWQALGIYAYGEPELQRRLQLSSRQQTQMEDTFQRLRDKISSLTRPEKSASGSGSQVSAAKLIAQAHKDIQALLSDRQRLMLGQILGRHYDLKPVRNLACKAPEFQPVEAWLHSSPLTWNDLKGKVTVVHFYTFGCINCKRNLPYYHRWVKRFPPAQFQMIGIHRPETQRERDLAQVTQKAAEAGMDYPIAVDTQSLNWDVWANRIWPSIYLVDKNGFVRYWWYGELNWQGAPSEKWMRAKIEELLQESYPTREKIPPPTS